MVQLFAVEKSTGKLKAVQVNSSGELMIAGKIEQDISLDGTAPGCGLIWSDGTRTGVFNQKGDVKK